MKSNEDKKIVVADIRREIEASKATHIWRDYVNALKLISQVVFTRSSGFILEIMQNAEDAGLGLDTPGRFEIKVGKHRVKITHNGRPFSDENVKALCGIRSSKKPERGTLGYLGIGFKSIFKVTDCPEIYSGGFQFKFDRNYKNWTDPSNTPWHVIPVWIDKPRENVDSETTTFIIPYREDAYYSTLVEEVEKIRTELYLFLRWLKKIEVIDEVSDRAWVLENVGETKEDITVLKHDNQEQRFKFFRRTLEVPDWVRQDRLTQEYRANVVHREIAIGFALDENGNLAPSEAGAMYGGVYSFLPLGEARSGAKFPIQADFLVQPGRDAINHEAKWNHWLVEEIARLCKEAIEHFKKHDKWKYQYLPAFEFKHHEGLESYDKLFGPKLIQTVEEFLRENECVPTKDGSWAKPGEVFRVTEERGVVEGLVSMGILREDEIASVMGGQPNLKRAHQDVKESVSNPIKKVDRWNILNNDDFLKSKSQASEAAAWFRSFYLWLYKNPAYETYFYYKERKRLKRYHNLKLVLTINVELLEGGKVSIFDITSSDPIIKELSDELQKSKCLLHPDVLTGAKDEEEQKALRGFLTGHTGVQILNTQTVCKEALLPKIQTDVSKPSPEELLKYTRYCQRILGAELGMDVQLWVLTKQGEVRPAKEVLFSIEFKPAQNWETYQQYVSGVSFISPRYIGDVESDEQLINWRKFFKAGGVKTAPDNGVEEFAMNYAKEKLGTRYKNVNPVEKRNFGYDMKAETSTGERIHVEVKGQSQDENVVLTGNEVEAADTHKNSFYLCVVSSIPENPTMHMVQNPAAPGIGKKDKLTIPIDIWRSAKWRE